MENKTFKKQTIFTFFLISTIILTTAFQLTASVSKKIFGFELGKQTYSEIVNLFDKQNTHYQKLYYKGYSNLKYLKLHDYEKFSKYGKVKEAWLSFDPDNKLYMIEIVWSDNSKKTFELLRDALDIKYGRTDSYKFGFKTKYTYENRKVKIELLHDSFGFDEKTTIIYTHKPSISQVNKMKQLIENDIKQKNANKVASDL